MTTMPFPYGSVNRAIEAEVGEGPTADALRDLCKAVQGQGAASPNGVIFRPGAPTAPPNYETWPEVEAAVIVLAGDCTLWFDGRFAPLVVPDTANLEGQYLLTIGGASDGVTDLGTGTTVTVQSGAKFRHIREVAANIIFEGVLHTPLFVTDSGKILSFTFDSGLRLLAGSTSSFYEAAAGSVAIVRTDLGPKFDNTAVPGVPVIDASAAAQFLLFATRSLSATQGAFKGGGATPILFVHDASTNQQDASFFTTGFQPFTPGSNDIFFDTSDGVSYDDARVAPFYIAAPPHAFNVQKALDAIKGLLPATAFRGNVLVFDASVPASFGNVFKTWPEVVAAANQAHGPLTIMLTPGSVMTAPGINYGDNLLLIGFGGFGPNPTPITTDNSGWNMSAVGLEIRDLGVLVKANGTAPFEGGNAGCEIILSGTTTIAVDATSGAPAFSLHGPPVPGPATQRVILKDQARLVGGGPHPALSCFELAPTGAALELYAYDQSVVEAQSCNYTASGGITLRQSDGATIDPNQNVPFVATTLGTYVLSFMNAMGPVVTVNHQLKSKYVIVAVYDDVDRVVDNLPVAVIDEDSLTIDLTVFGAFAGTLKAVVRRLRRTTMVAPISGTHSGGLFLPQPGGGYINAFQAVVASIATLSLIHDNDPAGSPPGYNALADGAFALVSNGAIKQPWFLDKASLVAPNGTTCVLADSAGGNPANPGRWFLATAQSPTVSMAQASIIWRPGGVSSGNVYATFPEVVAAANLANGDVQIAVDDSIAPAQVGAAEAINLHFRGGFVSGTGQKVKITVLPGGNIDNIGYSSSVTFAQLVAVLGTYPLTWSEASVTAAGSFVRCFNTAFEPQPGSVAGGVAFIDGAKNVVIYAEECSFTGAGAEPTASYGLVSEGTAQVEIIATSKCNLTPFGFKPNAAGTTITVSFDASTDLPPVLTGRFLGTLDYVMIDIANEVLFDDTSTVAPVNGGQPSIVVNPVIGGKSAQEALQALKPFLLPFDQTNANLVAGILTVNHNLNQQFVQVIIADDTDQKVDAPIKFVSPLSLTIDLNSFGVLPGGVDSWHVTVRI